MVRPIWPKQLPMELPTIRPDVSPPRRLCTDADRSMHGQLRTAKEARQSNEQ